MSAASLRIIMTVLGIVSVAASAYVIQERYRHAVLPEYRWPVIGLAVVAACLNFTGIWALWRWK